ncbi:MAG: HU family DNA-binding protein [Gemmatimonadetes bacterium]|nr:HU family DNA-binding protein [Gemmatimonadota bacterium]
MRCGTASAQPSNGATLCAVRRFGVFRVSPRRTGMARNPRPGEAVAIPREHMVRFRPASGLLTITSAR